MKKYIDYLITWLQNEVDKAGMNGVVVGLSGGIDSAVVAAISKKAFPDSSLGVYMPIGDMGQDLTDAKIIAKNIGIKTMEINLTETYNSIIKQIPLNSKIAKANIKPRLRMSSLYAISQEKKYLVIGTDNAAEWLLGYFTKYGDGGVDLNPLIHLTKGEVKDAAVHLGLPKFIINKKPTAGLWEGQTDEEELGFTYDEVDNYILGRNVEEKTLKKIKNQIKSTEHKRKSIPTPNKKQT